MAKVIQKKGIGYQAATGLGPGWNPRLMKAYAEGRRSYPSTSNPFTSGTADYTAWQYGQDNKADADYQVECAT